MIPANFKLLNTPITQDRIRILRDKNTPSFEFRNAIRDLGAFLAYEVSSQLPFDSVTVATPLAETRGLRVKEDQVTLVSILRAGNGLLDGVLPYFKGAKVGFVGLERRHDLTIREYYEKLPSELNDKTVVILDPMLATGHSANAAIEIIKQKGAKKILFCCIMAAPEGVEAIASAHPNIQIFTTCLDECLNEKGYIMPGLGDAGDRYFNSN